MTGRKTTALLARALGLAAEIVVMACLILPLTAHPAAACSVGIGYQPTIDISKPNMGLGNPCTDGTSITGAAIVAILAIGALAAAGVAAYRRAEASARPSSPDETLATYLNATGLTPSAHGHGPADPATRTPSGKH
jgi:hypothetical protein